MRRVGVPVEGPVTTIRIGNKSYADGCDLASSCLTCPLPACRFEYPGGVRSLNNLERDRQIVEARMVGTTPTKIAQQLGVGKRTVHRVLEDSGLEFPVLRGVYGPAAAARHASLADRDRQIVELFESGLKPREIARRLETSPSTVYRVVARDGREREEAAA